MALTNTFGGSSGQIHWSGKERIQKQSSASGIQEASNRMCTLSLNDRMFRPRSSSASNSAPSSIPSHVLHAKHSNDLDSKSVDRPNCVRVRTTPTIVTPDMWQDGSSRTCEGSPRLDRNAHSDNSAVQRRRKAVHRSRSDLTKRFSNSSEFSDLSARYSRNSADLEKFFNEMGLDQNVLEPMMFQQCRKTGGSSLKLSSSELHLFESMSSLNSPDTRSWCSEESYHNSETVGLRASKHSIVASNSSKGPSTNPISNMSVGDRNARVINWLSSVKKATSQDGETDLDREALKDIIIDNKNTNSNHNESAKK